MRLVQWAGPVTKPQRHQPGAAKAVQNMLLALGHSKAHQMEMLPKLLHVRCGIARGHHLKGSERLVTRAHG